MMKNKCVSAPSTPEGQAGKDGITFLSIHWSRLIAGIVLVVTGLLDLQALGYMLGSSLGEYIGTGVALFLGGVSFFWLIGFPIIIIGIVLVIYFLVSPIKYTFRFDSEESTFVATGKWLLASWTYQMSPVNRITYQRHRIGPKAWWIVIFVYMIVLIMQYGSGLFDLPRSTTNILPGMMMFTAASDSVALFILIYFMPASLRVHAQDRVYDFWVSCPPRKDVLKIYFESAHVQKASTPQSRKTSDPTRLVTGIVLCTGSLLGLFTKILFGEWFSMVGLMYGIILACEGLFLDFNQENLILEPSQDSSGFKVQRRVSPINYHLDIMEGSRKMNDTKHEVPAWHGIFITYLVVNAALQVVHSLKFGAIYDPLSFTDFIASIAFASFLGLLFYKLIRDPKTTKILLVASLVTGILLGLFI